MIPSPDSPILFSVGSFSLRFYSLCILLAVLIAQYIFVKRAKKRNIEDDHIYNIVIYGLLFGLLGARIFHVLYEYQYYFNNLSDIVKIWEGGLAIHGGLLFGTISTYIYAKVNKLSFFTLSDILIPGILLAQIIGRFGNYFNQEAFGTPTKLPWGIYIKEAYRPAEFINSLSFHPTFIYEGLWNALILGIILFIEKRFKVKTGFILGIYLIGYGIGRSLVEIIRTDATYLGPLKFVHWLSIILVLLGTILVLKRRK